MTQRALLCCPAALLALAALGACVSPLPQQPASSSKQAADGAAAARPPPGARSVAAPMLGWQMPARRSCAGSYAAPQPRGKLGDAQLLEASGLIASPTKPDVLWLHNDSGDLARLFAVGSDGRALGTIALPNVAAVDFEDIAAGPCPDLSGSCLYVADTGDNKLKRAELMVYAVPEPEVALDAPLRANSEAPFVWMFPLIVPERANIEALVVMPDASAMLLFEKTSGEGARVFRYAAPWTPQFPATLEVIGSIAVPGDFGPLRQITGADLHPSGARLLLRTYSAVLEARWDFAAGESTEQLVRAELVEVMRVEEPQGEAVAYDAVGTGIWTVSESPSGEAGPPLHHASCAE